MAMGPRLTDTNRQREPLAGRGAREPQPTDPNTPGPDRLLLHLTMTPTVQVPTLLEGETNFFVEDLTDNVITLATNTLAAVTNTSDNAAGQPTARKDKIQEKEDTLTPELMDQLLQLRSLTGPPEQRVPRIGLKVTDWTVLNHTPDTPAVDTPGGSHRGWEGHCDLGTEAHISDPNSHPTGARGPFRTLHPPHQPPLAHWLAVKTAMHWTVAAPVTDTTLPTTWLAQARKVVAYVRRQGMTQTQRWMSWPENEERIIKSRTANLQTHANKTRGTHQPREGHGPAYSIFEGRNTPKRAPKPALGAVRPKPRPHRRGRGHGPGDPNDLRRRQKQYRPRPSPNQSLRPAHNSHPTSARPCAPSTLMERKRKGSTSVRCRDSPKMGLVSRHSEAQNGHAGLTRQPTTENCVATFTRMGRESGHIQL